LKLIFIFNLGSSSAITLWKQSLQNFTRRCWYSTYSFLWNRTGLPLSCDGLVGTFTWRSFQLLQSTFHY